MKIIFIVPYPALGPSNRFRVEQYLPFLSKRGHKFSLRPFYSPGVYNILYERGFYLKKIFCLILSTLRRITDVIKAHNYDIIFIHREAFPLGGAIFEYLFKLTGKKIIYDFDDSIFLSNVSNYNRLANLLKSPSKIRKIIGMSDCVIAGNTYLKDCAINFNKNVHILPTSIDTEKYNIPESKMLREKIVIGWIGSNTTLKYLKILENVFPKISERYKNVSFVAVGKGLQEWQALKINIEFLGWSLESEVELLHGFDIGIMPLTNDEWSKGKCAFKAIQYMSVGIPVVASDIGMNRKVISDGTSGFLANNEAEWIEKLSLLIENRQLRREMGLAGRKIIEKRYSLKANAPKFLNLIESLKPK